MRDRKLTLQMKNIYIILNSKDSKSSGKSRNLIFNRKYKGYSVNDELFIEKRVRWRLLWYAKRFCPTEKNGSGV